jgi:hypothetical protein
LKLENGTGNKFFDREFIKTARQISGTGNSPYSLKQLLLLAIQRTATLERIMQAQINDLKEQKNENNRKSAAPSKSEVAGASAE